jgi:hypothetical protein
LRGVCPKQPRHLGTSKQTRTFGLGGGEYFLYLFNIVDPFRGKFHVERYVGRGTALVVDETFVLVGGMI